MMRFRPLRSLVFLAALAACDGGDGDILRPTLSPQEVSGAYEICALAFDPEGSVLPTVDIRERGFEPADPAAKIGEPLLRVDPGRIFELEYTGRGRVVPTRFGGTFGTSERSVLLSFDDPGVTNELLLPRTLSLDFQPSPRALAAARSSSYEVRRADYARMAGVQDEPNLPPQVRGTLTARFALSCP